MYNSSIVPALFYNKAEIILDATTILTIQERILSSKKSTRLYAAALFRVFFDAKKDEKFERYCVWEKSATKVLFSIGVSLDGTTTGLVCVNSVYFFCVFPHVKNHWTIAAGF